MKHLPPLKHLIKHEERMHARQSEWQALMLPSARNTVVHTASAKPLAATRHSWGERSLPGSVEGKGGSWGWGHRVGAALLEDGGDQALCSQPSPAKSISLATSHPPCLK